MATLREVRRRISGVKSTQKITKAMKMVAAAKLRRAQGNVVAARPYARKMTALLRHLIPFAEGHDSALITPREVKTVALVIVTADRGMCGAFNANLIKAAVSHLSTTYPGWSERGNVKIVCVGRKGADYFSKRQYAVTGRYIGIYDRLTFLDAQAVARELTTAYRAATYDLIEIIYNEFKSVAQQRIVVEQFLPVPPEPVPPQGAGQPVKHRGDYIYEPSRAAILGSLLPRHLSFQIWRILLESFAAEQGARMAAMDNATENAHEIIEALQLQYNKARQAAITKELLEVVSGAEALRGAE
jgi:F-type H+-transporting ATPase subunit gamma